MGSIFWMLQGRYLAFTISIILTVLGGAAMLAYRDLAWLAAIPTAIFGFLSLVGLRDLLQSKHAILRNYPILAHLRYFFEKIRPEMRQYFFEDDKDGRPFPRDKRAIVYQRAKDVLDKRPFGTVYDVYSGSYEWLNHSMAPRPIADHQFRVRIGGQTCAKPYDSSVLNVSGMSFGAISPNAIRSLNKGAKMGRFAQDTGEGSVSRYHREHGGDLIWQIGSGYFGCRDEQGNFSRERFAQTASDDQIKMIEIKLSQGAKPGHGGVLPQQKITREIAEARQVPMDRDCVSPAAHGAFSTPIEMLEFIAELRELSGGKPIGIKFCVGHRWQVLSLCKAMVETDLCPDFIVVDGKEGGTGAAPLEFTDHLGMPMRDGVSYVHNALVGCGLRERVVLGASGKIVTAFDMVRAMALGAEFCHSARAFMFAVGCIQAQSCHTGHCPTGVATTDPLRQRAVVVTDKAVRVYNYHHNTMEALAEVIAAAGLDHPRELRPQFLWQRISANTARNFAQLYPPMKPGALLEGTVEDERFKGPWMRAQANSFQPAEAPWY
ncbi:MAG: FMN-binding glutamate synthase family protein [Neomegalonema sp.]|nr:FMN-binding glutamate synthase family protein [Neomegalonema sp.]